MTAMGSRYCGALGTAITAARCPTPFAFPLTPLGLSLFDIDPSRILSMLHHQTWLAEESLRSRGLLNAPKEYAHRINPLGDYLCKEYRSSQMHTSTADLLAGISTSSSSTITTPKQTQLFKQQQQQQQPLNIRYPSPAALFHHQQQSHQLHQKYKHKSQSNPAPHTQTATSTQPNRDQDIEESNRNATKTGVERDDEDDVNEHSSSIHGEIGNTSESVANNRSTNSALLYTDSLEQLLQRRRSRSSLIGGDSLRSSYTHLLISSTPSGTETSSCKEKSSSSSTSSTPPPTSALLSQHQHLSQILKSPSETSSSLFGESIEEETRCVVCNAHFPNVWLLEQHAALQHPPYPGEEKPFICEQCGQSYRYRSAYAKHKEQNHRARLPADKLFTCDVCGMQFRYLKSFKKHRLNHALERLHGKKGVCGRQLTPAHLEQDIVTSSQETMMADEGGEDLRINIKREQIDEMQEEEQDSTIDSAGMLLFNDNSPASATISANEPNISSSERIHSTNKRPRVTNSDMETDPSFNHHIQHQQRHLSPSSQMHTSSSATATAANSHTTPASTMNSLNSLSSLNTITSLINAERIPNEQFLGLNPQEASILNFLRVDAAERQRDKRPQTSRFACPFCGKCVRSKENLKLHVRKHTGERPFVCLFCGRAFGGKSDLTRHLRIHTGERPYHCESCGKCFARADYLSKHLTTHIHNAPR